VTVCYNCARTTWECYNSAGCGYPHPHVWCATCSVRVVRCALRCAHRAPGHRRQISVVVRLLVSECTPTHMMGKRLDGSVSPIDQLSESVRARGHAAIYRSASLHCDGLALCFQRWSRREILDLGSRNNTQHNSLACRVTQSQRLAQPDLSAPSG